MSAGGFSIKKAIPIIVITWILSLITTLALVYVSPSIFPPLGGSNIADGAIVTIKLSDGKYIEHTYPLGDVKCKKDNGHVLKNTILKHLEKSVNAT